MVKGRNPRVIQDNEVSRRTKEEVEIIKDETPIYESQEFVPPTTLTKEQLEVWNWLVKVFHETIGCRVSDADVHLMELYCMSKVAVNEADAALRKDPRAYILVDAGLDRDGELKQVLKPNPNIKKRKENAELCLKYFDQLGLTPLARARAGIKGKNAKQEEDIYKLLTSRTD